MGKKSNLEAEVSSRPDRQNHSFDDFPRSSKPPILAYGKSGSGSEDPTETDTQPRGQSQYSENS